MSTAIGRGQGQNLASNITGRTDGLSPSAGCIGETIKGAGFRSFTANDTDGTGWVITPTTNMVLNSGVWLITSIVNVDISSGTTSGVKAYVLTTDTSDGWGPTVNLTPQYNANFPSTVTSGASLSRTDVVVIPASTSYNVRVKMYNDTHTAFTGGYYAYYTAVRIG